MSAAPASRRGIRGVVFDLDGTLVDSYAAIATSLNAARSAFDLPPLPVEEVRRSVGHGLERLISERVGPDRIEEGVRRFRDCYARVYASGTEALPHVADTLRALDRKGIALSVASNKPARFSKAILESLGLLERFRAVHGPDTVGSTKPDPAMIHRCLVDMGVDASRAVYVGDMALDVESADRAGVPVLLVPGGSCPVEELRSTGRTVLDDLSRLPGELERLPDRGDGTGPSVGGSAP